MILCIEELSLRDQGWSFSNSCSKTEEFSIPVPLNRGLLELSFMPKSWKVLEDFLELIHKVWRLSGVEGSKIVLGNAGLNGESGNGWRVGGGFGMDLGVEFCGKQENRSSRNNT